jgi:hypothetical protein
MEGGEFDKVKMMASEAVGLIREIREKR